MSDLPVDGERDLSWVSLEAAEILQTMSGMMENIFQFRQSAIERDRELRHRRTIEDLISSIRDLLQPQNDTLDASVAHNAHLEAEISTIRTEIKALEEEIAEKTVQLDTGTIELARMREELANLRQSNTGVRTIDRSPLLILSSPEAIAKRNNAVFDDQPSQSSDHLLNSSDDFPVNEHSDRALTLNMATLHMISPRTPADGRKKGRKSIFKRVVNALSHKPNKR